MPPVITEGMEVVGVEAQLREVVVGLSRERSLTCSDGSVSYVGVRPASGGAIAMYVNRAFLDVRLKVDRARDVARALGLPLIDPNGTNGIVRIRADRIGTPGTTLSQVVKLCEEAIDDRIAGPAFIPGGADAQRPAVDAVPSCPEHPWLQMLGGSCDQCE